jgi:hypothetical protein
MTTSVRYAERREPRRGRINFGILIPLFVMILTLLLSVLHWLDLV